MEMQSEVWTHEYHSMFHFGETEYDVYGKLDARINLDSPKSPLWEGIYLSPMNDLLSNVLPQQIQAHLFPNPSQWILSCHQ
mgnify:CR=1 FL=1